MLDLSSLSDFFAATLAPRFPEIDIFGEVETVRGPEDGVVPSLVVRSGPFSEIAPANYIYKTRFEFILYFNPDAAADFDATAKLEELESAVESMFAGWVGQSIGSLGVHLYEAKILPVVPQKSQLVFQYHIPVTLFLQF